MSWLRRDPEIFDGDLDVLEFKPEESRILTIERQNNAPDLTEFWVKSTCDDWKEWLQEDHTKRRNNGSTRINLILGGRAKASWEYDPSVVSALPWSYEIFSKVKRRFLVHSAIIRTINCNTSCMFSQMKFQWNVEGFKEDSLVYLCRTTASWPGDMALSVTFCPRSLTTNAVLFGCDMKTPDMYDDTVTLADIIVSRLKNSDTKVFHPMILPTIFADVERDRQIELVREKLWELGQRLDHLIINGSGHMQSSDVPQTLSNMALEPGSITLGEQQVFKKGRKYTINPFKRRAGQKNESITSGSVSEKQPRETRVQFNSALKPERSSAKLWQEISRLKIGLSNWQRQLVKMISHVEDLNDNEFSPQSSSHHRYEENQRVQLHETGIRIIERLRELVDEYDEYIRECNHIMDGFSLATQLEISQNGRNDAKTNQEISRVNLDVAKMTRRDGSIMKSIAMLGMVFLPATFATAFFSMDFFEFSTEENGSEVSKLVWIYALVAVTLTLGTVGIFYFCILRRRNTQEVSSAASSVESLA